MVKIARQGIFTRWEVGVLDSAEAYFKKNLETNPSFPFVEVQANYFVMQSKSTRFIGAVLQSLVVIILSAILYSTSESFYEYFVFTIIIALWPLPTMITSYQKRTYVIDNNESMYEFYIGEKLIYRGHLHNVYIRLTAVNSGGATWHYCVVLNGYMVEEESLTPTSTRREHLARMGRRLAQKLDVNFFDCSDKARTHVIRHRCPYRNNMGHLKGEGQLPGLPGLPAITILP